MQVSKRGDLSLLAWNRVPRGLGEAGQLGHLPEAFPLSPAQCYNAHEAALGIVKGSCAVSRVDSGVFFIKLWAASRGIPPACIPPEGAGAVDAVNIVIDPVKGGRAIFW
jgi:hypothetical protein